MVSDAEFERHLRENGVSWSVASAYRRTPPPTSTRDSRWEPHVYDEASGIVIAATTIVPNEKRGGSVITAAQTASTALPQRSRAPQNEREVQYCVGYNAMVSILLTPKSKEHQGGGETKSTIVSADASNKTPGRATYLRHLNENAVENFESTAHIVAIEKLYFIIVK